MFSFDRDKDTICAIATPPGSGGIAVLRVSGDEAATVSRRLCRFLPEQPESHRLYYGYLTRAEAAEGKEALKLDEVLVSYFEAGRSFTGEQTVEISCHGGRFLSSMILKELIAAGARLAEPGEFTYRAFMNQRLDLVQAEAVLELINSENISASKLALRQLEGGFSADLKEVKIELTSGLAHLEANIDFAAEDIQIASNRQISQRLEAARAKLRALREQYRIGRRAREGLSLLLVGEPNVGKSSLLNVLVREEKAIVTAVPGTTRDLIESSFEAGGLPVKVTDTAGFRDTEDPVEKIGIDRMRGQLDAVDFVVAVIGADQPSAKILELVAPLRPEGRLILVFNKMDLLPSGAEGDLQSWLVEKSGPEFKSLAETGNLLFLSSTTKAGLDQLLKRIHREVEEMSETRSTGLMNARHFELITKALNFVEQGMELLDKDESPEFVAAEFHSALRAIYGILGEQFDDQVMDQVFREFCLGK
jgi:tRNA modification GTPase